MVAFVGIPALGLLGRGYGELAALLLGSEPRSRAERPGHASCEGARSRIIAAADAERRRIERDLHDGAQQRLVALSLTLRMAETRAEKGDPETADLIRNAGEEAGLALKDLRDLARGIHPAILTNRGLAAALDDLAARATVPVEVTAAPPERLPDQVEAAAYFVVSECLANVGKHAEASGATVSVRTEGGRLEVEVQDDGTGGADTENGSGIQGLRDRVGALGGRLEIESPEAGARACARRSRWSCPRISTTRWRRRAPPYSRTTTRPRSRPGARGDCGYASGIVAGVAATLVLIWAAHGDRQALDRLAAARSRPRRSTRRVVRAGRPAAARVGPRRAPVTTARRRSARYAGAGACASTRAPWSSSTSS